MKLATILFALTALTPAFADNGIECPKTVLSCERQSLTSIGTWSTVETKSAQFEAINEDEPSEEPNDCKIWLSFSSPSGSFVVTVHRDLETFLTPGTAHFYPTPGSPFTVRDGNSGPEQLVCRLSN